VRVYQPDGTHQLRPGSFVEPVHLQVICQSLWRIKKDAPVVTQAHLAELGRGKGTGVDEVLAAYYAERVKEAAGASVSERRIREWFSTQLISAEGVRRLIPVHEAGKFGLTPTCLGGLDRAFLIRREDRSGTQWYELAHDRLITPIRADNEAWRAANLNTFQLQAELWSKGDRSRDLLVSGELLEEGGRWAEAHRDSLTDVEAAFLEECREAQKLANREREFQEVREGRVRLIYGALGGGATLLILLAIAAVLAIYFSNKADREKQARAGVQVERLLEAPANAFPYLLADLPLENPAALSRLRQVWADEHGSRRMRVRAGLALLALEPDTMRDEMAKWMQSEDDPAEMLLICNALKPHGKELASELWRQLQGKAKEEKRLRLLVALAAFDPGNQNWGTAARTGVQPLLSANPLRLGLWVEALRPVKSAWVPALLEVFRGPKAEKRDVAASVLAEYVRDDPAELTNLLLDADTRQYAILFPRLAAHRDQALGLLRQELDRLRQERDRLREPGLSKGNQLASQQANASVALARLGEDESTWELLRWSADPTVRSYLVERLGSRGVPATAVLARLEPEKKKEVSIRRALILALGEYGEDQLPKEKREPWVRRLLEWYQRDPDAGVHGAIDWLLRHGKEGEANRPLDWGQAKELERIDGELKRKDPEQGRGWYVNGQGQTMVLIRGPVEFDMGSPQSEIDGQRARKTELQHRRPLPRSFAIASKAVTVEQFYRFLNSKRTNPDVKKTYENHKNSYPHTKDYCPDPQGPMISVTWFEAAQYCRWLSEEEEVPEEQMCYPRVEEIRPGMMLPAKCLDKTGYRLPTEAECEYACRAGARTIRYFGSSEDVLGRYAWYALNSGGHAWPVGQLKPNDLGLFDMHGNAWTWCHDRFLLYPEEDDKNQVTGDEERMIRGGSFYNLPVGVRAAYRSFGYKPEVRETTMGFRVARTWREP
jgi:formylglycine-generating enzyme required for sulfatase activity